MGTSCSGSWLGSHRCPSSSATQRSTRLSPADRDALIALAQAREVAAEEDLVRTLSSGHHGLDKLREVEEPADLLTVINLAMRGRPELVVEALFAALVLYRDWDAAEPAAIGGLRERWHRHIHEQVAGVKEPEELQADEDRDGA